jgi:DNA-directed RNA polymerase specialized sigma24 family protein
MTKLAELAYDIEQLYIDGVSPKRIAEILECPLTTVYEWLEDVGMATAEDETIDPDEWDAAFPQEPYYGA